MVIKYLLRMDAEVYDKLQDAAEKEDRSVNSLINTIIKKYLKIK